MQKFDLYVSSKLNKACNLFAKERGLYPSKILYISSTIPSDLIRTCTSHQLYLIMCAVDDSFQSGKSCSIDKNLKGGNKNDN